MSVRSLISFTLGSNFPGVEVYKEQGAKIKRPAFSILEIENSQKKRIGNRYKRVSDWVINYYPEEDNLSDYEELSEVIGDKLYSIMEHMEFDGCKLRGTEMKHRIEDNTLQFFLTIKEQLQRPTNETKMQELEIQQNKKG